MNTRNADIGWLETVGETLAAIKPGTQEAKMVEAWVEKNYDERDKSQAACAVMREALERVWEIEEMGYTPDDPESESGVSVCNKCEGVQHHNHKSHSENCPQPVIETALSTDCGKDLLANYQEAVELLRETVGVKGSSVFWFNRRDTLLAKVKGGSNG